MTAIIRQTRTKWSKGREESHGGRELSGDDDERSFDGWRGNTAKRVERDAGRIEGRKEEESDTGGYNIGGDFSVEPRTPAVWGWLEFFELRNAAHHHHRHSQQPPATLRTLLVTTMPWRNCCHRRWRYYLTCLHAGRSNFESSIPLPSPPRRTLNPLRFNGHECRDGILDKSSGREEVDRLSAAEARE